MLELEIFSEDCVISFDKSDNFVGWIADTIAEEGKVADAINIIFCSDDYLLKMNLQYLDHDYYTDVITFDYCEDMPEENMVSGDLFISIDRVKENAEIFNCTFDRELNRVIIHGILHLLGYKDKKEKEQLEMRSKEDYFLTKLQERV